MAGNLTSLPTATVPSLPRKEAKVTPSFVAISGVISTLAVPRIPEVPKSLSFVTEIPFYLFLKLDRRLISPVFRGYERL
ncbi:MAG: hypothetical protein OEX76_05625 [Candidatus Bathyarchaeota archaeon]|nr:hypothetical protein [Candidatus Bathyarchaeota archaeon]